MTIKIVIADDHTLVRDGLEKILAPEPDLRIVGKAGNGREAVDLCVSLKPDIALLDISMPILSGMDALEQIRKSCPHTRNIMLSMHDSPEYIWRALDLGAYGYLLKESAGDEVVKAVRAVFRGNQFLGEKVAGIVIQHQLRNRKKAPFAGLSPREKTIFDLIVKGIPSG